MATSRHKAFRWMLLFAAILLGAFAAGEAVRTFYMVATDRWPGLPPEKIVEPTVTYSKMPPEAKFSISLQPPVDHPARDRDLTITLVILNWGDDPVELTPVDPGGRPFKAAECPAMQIDSGEAAGGVAVEAHTGRSIAVHLRATCEPGAQPILLFYRARTLHGGQTVSELDGYIATSPLPLVTEERRTQARAFRLAGELLRLLLVPIALAAFGLWLNSLVARRDEKLKQEQEARDRRNEVLNTLIANYRDLVVGDYLPISRRMQTVESQLPEALKSLTSTHLTKPPSEPQLPSGLRLPPAGKLSPRINDLDGLLCAILLCRARLLHFLTQKGGIYFRSKQAEMLFRDLINGFFGKCQSMLGDDDFRRAVDMLGAEDTLAAAIERYHSGTATAGKPLRENQEVYQRVQKRFVAWVNDSPEGFRAHTRLLQIATELLAFECDRPFYQTAPLTSEVTPALRTSGWYFDPPVVEFTAAMYEIPEALKQPTLDDLKTGEKGRKGIYPQLTNYLESLPEECRAGVPMPQL